LTFLLPELAVVEARTLRPHTKESIEELLNHPHVVLATMSPTDATEVERLLAAGRTSDVTAAWVVMRSS